MKLRSRKRLLLSVATAVAVVAAGGFAVTASAQSQSQSVTNSGQADGPGIMTIEQVNMCMWESDEALPCFENPYEEGEDGYEEAELATAKKKRDSVVTQYKRHNPDVFTVSEGCSSDLEAVAKEIGYELRYQETGGGTDNKARKCSVDRGVTVNAILAKTFIGDGPQGYFEKQGYRAYICAQVSTDEWDSVRVCTAHLSLGSQDNHREIECKYLKDKVLEPSEGTVLFAGDVNMKGDGQNCAPSRYNGLKNTERDSADNTGTSGLQHIYYIGGNYRQSCGWSYEVDHTDHRGFLLELGKSAADNGPCWRGIR